MDTMTRAAPGRQVAYRDPKPNADGTVTTYFTDGSYGYEKGGQFYDGQGRPMQQNPKTYVPPGAQNPMNTPPAGPMQSPWPWGQQPTMPMGGSKRILVQFRPNAGPTAISGVANAMGNVQAEQMGNGLVAFTVPAEMADTYVAQLGTNPSIAAASAEGGQTAVTQTTRAGPDVAAPILSGQQPAGPQAPGFNTPVNWGGSGDQPKNLWDIWQGGQGGTKTRTPNPWQVNPAVWDSMGETGQQLALSFAEDEGWDANDYQRQINATRPQGRAPRSTSLGFSQPQRL